MANDPNNSGNGNSPNSIGDFGLSRLAEIANENRPSAEERELRRKAKTARAGMEVYEGLSGEANQYAPIRKWYDRDVKTVSRTEPRIRIAVEARQQRLMNQAVNTVSREFSESSINGQVNEAMGSPEAQHSAMRMMNTPYTDLIGEQRARQARLQELGEANKAMASRVIGRKGLNSEVFANMQANTREAQGIVNELGTYSAALGQQKTLGNDPRSKTAGLISDVSRAQGIGSGDSAFGSAQKLIQAFEELSKVTDVTSKEFKDLQKTTDEARKQFAEGGGSGGGYSTAGKLGLVSGGFSAAAGAVQQIMVNQRLQQAQNATGLADIENQKYQTYKAAAGGDIASLMQLSQFSGAESFGGGVGTAAKVAVGAQGIAGIAQAAMGGVQLANVAEDVMDSGSAGINNIIGGVASTATAGFDLARGVSENQARIAATNARLAVSHAVNAVGAEQVQGFRDFSVGMGTAAIGLGARGEALLNRTMSGATLDSMSSARISPEQFAQMSQLGVANMGSMFNENQIFSSRTNEQRGLGTMQENMQRLGQLSAAGSNNPTESLGAITEGAVMKGLDSSKALNAVVDHTASMAAASTGRAFGIDTSAAASALLTAGINKDTPNKEAALERSAGLQDTFNRVGTNAGVSYTGMVNTARIGRSTGLGGVDSIIASQISDQDLMSMNKGNAETMLKGLGIDMRGKNAPDMVAKLKEDRQMQLMDTGNLAISYDKADALKRINNKDKLTEDEERGMNKAASLLSYSSGVKVTGDDLRNRIAGIQGTGPKETFGPVNVDDNSKRASTDLLRTAGFAQLSTAASTAATNLGGASAALNTLTTAIKSLHDAMPNMEKTATVAAGKAAAGEKGMDMHIGDFNLAIDKLNKVLNNALAKSNLGAGSSDKQRAKPPGP